jgi:signal peptidase I
MKAVLREVALTLILAIIIFVLLQATVQSFVIIGSSMQPNFHEGERLLINKVVYKFRQPERGDVIIFHPPSGQQTDYIKRVIGLPGESVEIKDGVVYIHEEGGNVFSLAESYIADPAGEDFEGDKIPENEYFVLGDNRNNSNDSRNFGPVSREAIIGKAWFSFWPSSDWGLVSHYPIEEQLASPAE